MKGIIPFYNLAWIIGAPVLLPLYLAFNRVKGKRYAGFRERLALFPPIDFSGKSSVWCHAISVGELNALLPVARAVRLKNPSRPLVITTQTKAGMETARKRFDFADATLYAPLDHPWIVERFIRRFRPSILLVMETGYWPNMLIRARMRGAGTILAQARMSERSLRRWKRFPSLLRRMLGLFDLITVEDVSALHRFAAVGADREIFRVIPNTKFDGLEPMTADERSSIRKKLGLAPSDPVLVAGSTHQGEEREMAEAFEIIRRDYPESVMILAPRRLERLEEVRREISAYNLPVRCWTDIRPGERVDGVVIVNTMGELAGLYGIATAAFVGKSLQPPGGGHSLLEPAAQGVPVMHGPYVENTADIADRLAGLGAAAVVKGAEDVADYVKQVIRSPEIYRAAALRAAEWIGEQQGASSTLADIILRETPPRKNAA